MNKWVRNVMVEESYKDLHGVKPEIHFQRINNQCYQNKLILKGKEVIIREVMENGLTKEASLEYEGKVTTYPSVFKAEQVATKILRGKTNGHIG